jgi:DNA processing protein
VVGARRYSAYGREACQSLISGLAGLPISIVSGLAIGIDEIAHSAALKAGLHCIAVPGSGLDDKVLYPSSNRRLAADIMQKGGALLSEFAPDLQAAPWTFPQRNRIMAGLSDAVLVIEAEIKSGTLITSKLATEYNRDVFAVPGSIFSPQSAGPHMLLRLGATPITCAKELAAALGFSNESDAAIERQYTDEELQVIRMLSSPLPRDDILRALGKPIHIGNTLLSAMELKGLIIERMGQLHKV